MLKKNPSYWETGRPYLDNLTFKTTASDESALEAMQAGQGQAYAGMSSPQLLNSYKSKFTVTSRSRRRRRMTSRVNTAIPPFNNIKARPGDLLRHRCGTDR